MVGEKNVQTWRPIQTCWLLSCTVTERFHTSKIMKWIWKLQNTSHSWPIEFIHWATLTYLSNGALYWMKHLFIIETNSFTDWCSLSKEQYRRLYSRRKLSFEDNSVRKNLFLSACFSQDSRVSLREMDQKFKFFGTIGYGDSYLEVFFVISKFLDYTQ